MSQPIASPFEVTRFIEHALPQHLQRVTAAWAPTLPRVAWAVRIEAQGAWTLRLGPEGVGVERGVAPDCLLQVSVGESDLESAVGRLAQASASRSVTRADLQWTTESLDLVRSAPGTTRVVLVAGTCRHQILLTPGARASDPEPNCTLECELTELVEVAQGKQSLMQLFFEGKLQLTGDPTFALALTSLAVGS